MATKARERLRSVSFGEEADAGSLLATLADISARLTDARPTELVAFDVLETACAAACVSECAVWLEGIHGLTRTWAAGTEETPQKTVLRSLKSSEEVANCVVREMRYGPRRVGAIVVSRELPLGDDVVLFTEALASILAAFVASSERSKRLESDLQARMLEVEEQKRFTETIVDMLPLGLYVIDREYRITVWNRKRETGMQGVSREDALGRPIFEILSRQPADVVRREFEEVFATGKPQQFQVESMASGTMHTYRISKIPLRDTDGEVTHVITMGEDITDWVEAREAVAQTDKLAAIGRLAAGIMHEINNPLATISACAETMAMETTVAEGSPEYLKIIESEVQRCKRIVDGLLDFSRPRARDRVSLNVNGVVERALFLLKHHARFKQITVDTQFGADLPAVVANAEQLIQVLIALLMNAADALPQYGNVRIRTRRVPGERQVVIEVQDEGLGMNRNQMARIFEPFFTTKEAGKGTGLGLAICHGIVADHGGRIEVASEEHKGTRFTIILPAEEA